MKKSLLITMMAIWSCINCFGDWYTGDHETMIIDDVIGGNYGTIPAGQLTSDGKLVVTWRVDHYYPGYYGDFCMQVIDRDGNFILEENGKCLLQFKIPKRLNCLCSQTSYYSALTEDDNLVVAYVPNEGSEGMSRIYTRMYNLNGEPLWDENLGKFPSSPVGEKTELHVSEVIAEGNAIYVGAMFHGEAINSGEGQETTENKDGFIVIKYDCNGSEIWEKPYEIECKEGFLAHTGDGGLMIMTYGPDQELRAIRLDADGNEVWEKPVILDSAVKADPPRIIRLDNGNYSVVFQKNEGCFINILTPEGELLKESPVSCNGNQSGRQDDCLATVYENNTAIIWLNHTTTQYFSVVMNEFDPDCNYAWGGSSEKGVDLGFWGEFNIVGSPYGWIVNYYKSTAHDYANQRLLRIDRAGNVVSERQLLDENTAVIVNQIICDGDRLYLCLQTPPIPTHNHNLNYLEGIRVMCLDISEESWSSTPDIFVEDANASRCYDMQGRELSAPPPHGIFILNGRKIVR